MAVYRNKNDDTIIRGSEFKLDFIAGHELAVTLMM